MQTRRLTLARQATRARVWLALLCATTALVALTCGLLAPETWRTALAGETDLPAAPATAFALWLVNFVIVVVVPLGTACLLVCGGAQTASRTALVVALLVTVGQLRHAVAVGVVGGLDPVWLARASTWGAFEYVALSVSAASVWRLWALPRGPRALAVARTALVACAALLAVGAVVEVLVG